jgi:uncharacterized phiE125 gp8 family phage protein
VKTYGSLELTIASPAQSFVEPLELDEVSKYLKQTQDSDEVEMIEGFIAAARETAELLQGRDLIEKQYDLYLDLFVGECDGSIELRKPLQSVDLVQYRNSDGDLTTLIEDTDYIVDTARGLIAPAYGTDWPWFTAHPSSAVLIRFTSGYASTHPFWSNAGRRIKVGMLMLISMWYEQRIPFIPSNRGELKEIPFAVTNLLSWGAVPRVR